MRILFDDFRFGLRQLRHAPVFATVAMLTFAVGIASTVTVFSWVDGLLLHPFPGTSRPGRLAVLEGADPAAPNGGVHLSYFEYRHYRDTLQTLDGLAAEQQLFFRVGDAANAASVWGGLVSGNYFSVLGVVAVRGRLFDATEHADRSGDFPVAVISERLWRTYFEGSPQVVGRTVRVNGRQMTVIGVAGGGFRGTSTAIVHDLWIPFSMAVAMGAAHERTYTTARSGGLYAVARLKPGVSVEQASREAATAARRLAASLPATDARHVAAVVRPVWQMRTGPTALMLEPLALLMAMSGLVLLVACANVANLLLARLAARQRELGTRMALGATRPSLLRRFFVEALLLAGGGAIVGVPMASWLADALPALVPDVGVPVALGFTLNTRIVLFTVSACFAAAVLAAVVPAAVQARSSPLAALSDGSRGVSSTRGQRLRAGLVVAEVALAAVSLVGAGLFIRSFDNARAIHPGFDASRLVLARLHMASAELTGEDVIRFCRTIRQRLEQTPALEGATCADFAPLGSTAGPWTGVEVPGYAAAPGERMSVNKATVAPGYFGVMGLPLVAGREFTESDDEAAAPVAIVNEAFAHRFFAGAEPVGRTIRAWDRTHTIVGLARNGKYFSTAEAPVPFFYVPFAQRYRIGEGGLYVIARSARSDQAAAAIRAAVSAEHQEAAAFSVFPMSEWMSVTLLPLAVAARLLTALGVVSVLLAGVGLYGVVSYAVVQRTREIGIRMALGAPPRQVMYGVLGRGLFLTITGLAIGIAAALALGRFVASLLVHVGPGDPLTIAAVAAFLAAVAALASYVPASRATRVDPVVALRCE